MRLAPVTLLAAASLSFVVPGALGDPLPHHGAPLRAITHRSLPDAILVATPRRGKPLVLRNRPAGRALAVLHRRTELGSQVKLGIAITRGNWIAVISESLPNGQLGWVPRKRVTVLRIRWSIDVSLSRVSAGCLHARDSDLRLLMRLTPLGTPVVISA